MGGFRKVGDLIAGIAVLAAAIFLVSAFADAVTADGAEPIVYDNPSSGPIYDLPSGYRQSVVVEREGNRAYVLVEKGDSFAIFPYLDSDGNQVVVDRP